MWSVQLQKDFGLLGETTADSKVLEGTYIASEVSSESMVGMLHMIGELAIGVKDTMVDIVITLQGYIKYWKCCREKKSSSASGLHYGHCKAAASNNEVPGLNAMMTQI